ncbi:permease [Gorillibacterium timonense]|uniref:permease n=1 Tax=Gorillibacterium timonense TaxID=1689269 RepID=UPI0009EA209E|nr:permease [Gorillibacterium timonense]
MRTGSFRTSIPWLFLLVICTAGTVIRLSPNHRALTMTLPAADIIMSFKTMLIGIVLEALPFMLLGVAVSAFMQVFVSEQTLRKLIPNHPLGGIAVACLLCVLFPLCECGIVPIVRRLMAKGMPVYIGVVFLLVGPIVNPVVYAATLTAFRSNPEMSYARMGFGLLVGCGIALVVYAIKIRQPLKLDKEQLYAQAQQARQEGSTPTAIGHRLSQAFSHMGHEFFEMGKYLLLGSVLTAAIQTGVPRSAITGIGSHPLTGSLVMMGFAFVLSLCSTSDAFVAASFTGAFPPSALLAFLVLGPMLDLKGTLMLLSVFRGKFVLLLSILVVLFVLGGVLLIHQFGSALGLT